MVFLTGGFFLMYHPLFPLSKLHRPREHAFTTPI
nr:MAG TPA: hypothetical protein [Caudoviricetes sp.]